MSAREVGAKGATLNARQQAFMMEYLSDINRNATQAYIRAGYAARGNAAEVSASKLLRNTNPSLSFGTTTPSGIIDLGRYRGVYGTTFV
jgi:hypothetical protein